MVRGSGKFVVAGDTRGVAFVEYVVLLGTVTILGSLLVYSLGVPLLSTYRHTQAIVAQPYP